MKKIVVLAKQVPDTANVGSNAMKEDGTVNRAVLPAVFNPEDLNALEMALQIKDELGFEVVVITMGPPKAAEILKHSLYMGADKVFLISDRKFAGADTLATSYVLSEAIKQIDDVVLVLAGRQAIDGDTAQVGPQTAEKINFNQISYVSKLLNVTEKDITVERDGEVQTEEVKSPFPVLLTVTSSANTPRFPNARKMLQYFKAETKFNLKEDKIKQYEKNNLLIPVKTIADLGIDPLRCGLKGSPTKVHKIKNIVLKGGDLQMFDSDPQNIKQLADELMKEYVEVN